MTSWGPGGAPQDPRPGPGSPPPPPGYTYPQGQWQPTHAGQYPGGQYPAGQYPPQYAQHPLARPGNGLAVASLVLGITSIIFSWWGLLTLAQVVLAIIFGAIGISRANAGASGKGQAVAGLILGCIGLVIYFFIGLFSLGLGWFI